MDSQHSPPPPDQPKPKGILKNAARQDTDPNNPSTRLTWDEENLALTEIQKDSLMKITEPKTPYVRYNPLTDEVEGDIPGLSLDGNEAPADPNSPKRGQTPQKEEDPSSRRGSVSSSGKRPGSGASSRSTSFSLPTEDRVLVKPGEDVVVDEVEEDEEMDEEAKARRAAFVKARGRHYSNEGEAMKRARRLMDEEEDASAEGKVVNGHATAI